MSLVMDENTIWKDRNGNDISIGRKFRYFDENGKILGVDIVKGPIFEVSTKHHPNGVDMIVVEVASTEGSNGLVVPRNRIELI